MLVRITNKCRMGCSHCLADARPDGRHMPPELFARAARFTRWIEAGRGLLFISGGEPTEHPQFAEMVEGALLDNWPPERVLVASNGMFLGDAALRDRILSLGVNIQVTNDPRFYPRRIERIEHPLLVYEDEIRLLMPLGRARGNDAMERLARLPPGTRGGIGIRRRQSPCCFNLRSAVRSLGGFTAAIGVLRANGKFCSPSISIDGSIVAGESPFCHKIGTIDSTPEDLARGVLGMSCNGCGLEDDLMPEHRRAIGLD
jgi:hypothetical protein